MTHSDPTAHAEPQQHELHHPEHPEHIAIVGAGIIGLSHAVAALDAGYRVTVVEQDAQVVSASVRNFGHIGVTVHEGELGELARASLPHWHSLAERAGLDVRGSGTLVVAEDELESDVLQQYLDAGAPAGVLDLTGEAAAEMLGTRAVFTRGVILPEDLTADPRTTVARLAAWVDAHERGNVRFNTPVQQAETGVLRTGRGDIFADHIIVSVGHLVGHLFPQLADDSEVRECALQVMRVRAPHEMGFGAAADGGSADGSAAGGGPAVLTGTSMLRYTAFAGSAADVLRRELRERRPELFEIDANIMLTQQSDGTLIVGDSHETHDTVPPFLDERWSQILLGEVARLLGAPSVDSLEVLERWQGIYATSAKQKILRATPSPGVNVVTVTTGLGMTVGPALGAETVARLAEAASLSLPELV